MDMTADQERQMHREQEVAYNMEQESEYNAWLSAQAPPEARWDEGPCYICAQHVPRNQGWHREDYDGVRRHWCADHQPVWSRGNS